VIGVLQRIRRADAEGREAAYVTFMGLTQREVSELATYNAECSRGIVHREDWRERMAGLQARFDAAAARRAGKVTPGRGS
jgi:hypothetical protein